MSDYIEVKDDIIESIDNFNKTNQNLDNLWEIFKIIKEQLEDESWSGKSNEQAKQVHELIELYYKSIRELYEDIQKDIQTLKDNTNEFYFNSDNIKMLGNL
jgi:archaellum component FlaC